jgi:RNA-directed DNA polymerase
VGRDNRTRKQLSYKGEPRSARSPLWEVGGGDSTVDRQDNITCREGSSPALAGIYSDEEEPVTAAGLTPLAQCTLEKVQVLQRRLHQAAKKDLGRTFGILYDKICLWEVLWTSWIRVQRNKGAPGVDGRTIQAIKNDGEVNFIRSIQTKLKEKSYRPRPIRRVYIAKSNGKLRPLGIPVVEDRVVQGAVKLILEPIFEANFMEESYGFRPRRGCKDALRSIRKWVTFGYSTVIDADISGYFDNVDHTLLLNLVQRRVRDKWILRLIRGWLKCRIFDQDRKLLAERGTPQGGVLSPLLANIYLHPLDKYWNERHGETKLVRYCDDFVVLIRRRKPERYFQSLQSFLKRLKLGLSPEKTSIVDARDGFDFLGVRLHLKPTRRNRGRSFCYGFPTPKSMKAVRSQVREHLGRDYCKSLEHMIEYVNPILRGWCNYYSWLNSGEHFHDIDRYVGHKFNRWNRRKQGRVRRRYRWLSDQDLHNHGLYRLSGRIVYVT